MDFINNETMRPEGYMETLKIKNIIEFVHCIDHPKTKLNQLSLIINLDGQRLDKIETFAIYDDGIISEDMFESHIAYAIHMSLNHALSGLNHHLYHVKHTLLSEDFMLYERHGFIKSPYDFAIAEEVDFISDIIYSYELRILDTISYLGEEKICTR